MTVHQRIEVVYGSSRQLSPQEQSANNRNNIILMYRILDPIDRFILMALVENEYTQEEVARMCGFSQEAVSKRFNKSKELLLLHEEELLM